MPNDSCSSRHSERPCPQSNNQVESSRRWHPVPTSGCSTCTHMRNACVHHPPQRIYVVYLKFRFNCLLSDQERREIRRAVNCARREHAPGNKRGPRIRRAGQNECHKIDIARARSHFSSRLRCGCGGWVYQAEDEGRTLSLKGSDSIL